MRKACGEFILFLLSASAVFYVQLSLLLYFNNMQNPIFAALVGTSVNLLLSSLILILPYLALSASYPKSARSYSASLALIAMLSFIKLLVYSFIIPFPYDDNGVKMPQYLRYASIGAYVFPSIAVGIWIQISIGRIFRYNNK